MTKRADGDPNAPAPAHDPDPEAGSILTRLQGALEGLYRVTARGDVRDFVIDEPGRQALGVTRSPGEQLLLRHDPGSERLDIGLYVDEVALRRLEGRFGPERLPEFLLAAEGVSHFVYVMVRAHADRPFSALELELQAEVDKYLLLLLATWRNGGPRPAGSLRRRLFSHIRFHADLSPEERERYGTANAAADEYAAGLEQRYVRHGAADDLLREVRRFYRLDCAAKLDRIRQKAA